MFTQYDKAIAAFITPFIVIFLAPFGVSADMTVENAIAALVISGLTSLSVFITRNK